MFFSKLPFAFKSPKPCILNNGTTIYYGSSALDCSCLADIRADPDFAGPGVIAAFIATCWLTIIIAAIPTCYGLWISWTRTEGPWRFWRFLWANLQFEDVEQAGTRRRNTFLATPKRPVLRDSDLTSGSKSDSDDDPKTGNSNQRDELPPRSQLPRIREPAYCKFARRITLQLCDVQIITGIAVLVAALAQYKKLTFYHAQFAVQFWWMTLNSFWVSRIDYTRNTPEMATARASVRRVALWLSVALSIVLQVIIAKREKANWDPTRPGRCYVSDSTGTGFGQNLFWLAGTVIYFTSISLGLFSGSRKWFDENVNAKIVPSIKATQQWARESWTDTKTYRSEKHSTILGLGIRYIRTFLYILAWITWFLFCLFVTVWCAGNSAALFELGLYSIFAGFLTWWIVFLKVQNKPLIRGDETRFTLGQTLPLLLFILVAIHSVDVWAGVAQEEKKGANRRWNRDGVRSEDLETSTRNGNEESIDDDAVACGMATTNPIEPVTLPSSRFRGVNDEEHSRHQLPNNRGKRKDVG